MDKLDRAGLIFIGLLFCLAFTMVLLGVGPNT